MDTEMVIGHEQLTLQECAVLLHAETDLGGSVPSLVTLKRWSAAGLLDAAKSVPEGAARVKYQYQNVLKEVQARIKRSRHPRPVRSHATTQEPTTKRPSNPWAYQSPDAKTASQTIGVSLEQVTETIRADLNKILEVALVASQKQIIDGLANLEATRKSLMLRYDGEIHYLRSRVEELSIENKRLKGESSGLDAARINANLTHIRDNLASLATRIESSP